MRLVQVRFGLYKKGYLKQKKTSLLKNISVPIGAIAKSFEKLESSSQ